MPFMNVHYKIRIFQKSILWLILQGVFFISAKYGTWVVVDRIIYIQIVGLLKKQKQNI